jgi:hypothetical protein
MKHTALPKERWMKFSLVEKMANIGSEVIRAMQWQNKHNPEYAKSACENALELFDLTLADTKNPAELKEIARARELWLDFFMGDNLYHQDQTMWQKYFLAFNYAAQLNK